MKKLHLFWPLLGGLFFALQIEAQVTIAYNPFITGLSAPDEVVNAGDGTARLFIVQQGGTIKVYDPANGGLQATPFLDVSSLVRFDGEQGLLSAAFHPDYETNGYFFIYYNNTSGDVTVARYHATGMSNTADGGSGVVLLTIPKPFTNHNGGHLQFARDSTLYFATGDGGSANDPNNNAQNGLSLLGKMIRLDVSNFTTPPYYTIPASNPFVGNAAYDSRIWALGLRNPYRWSFDRQTGDMWIGDVGQYTKEEVNYRPGSSTGGENYGWRCYEGSIHTPGVTFCDPPGAIVPVFEYDNPNGASPPSSSVIGGYVYRGGEYPFFNGYHISCDVYSGTIYLLKPDGAGGFTPAAQTGLQNFVVGFGEAEDGTIYAVSQATAMVYKVVPTPVTLPVTLSSFTGKRFSNFNELRWTTAREQNIAKFGIEYSTDAIRFLHAGEVPASGNGGGTYSFNHHLTSTAALFYRLAIVENNGSISYSSVVKLDGKDGNYRIYPTVIRNGLVQITGNGDVNKFQVISSNGSLVYEKTAGAVSGQLTVSLPRLPTGIYVVRIIGTALYTAKVLIE